MALLGDVICDDFIRIKAYDSWVHVKYVIEYDQVFYSMTHDMMM